MRKDNLPTDLLAALCTATYDQNTSSGKEWQLPNLKTFGQDMFLFLFFLYNPQQFEVHPFARKLLRFYGIDTALHLKKEQKYL